VPSIGGGHSGVVTEPPSLAGLPVPVWQGPRHDAPVPDVVAFVEALLTGAEHVPYLRLG
jgi:hypothetical protein